MRIVPHVAAFSDTPDTRLLTAPRIAGLLPARTPARIEIVQHQSYKQDVAYTDSSRSPRVVYRTFAEWRAADEALRQHFEQSHPYLRNLYQRIYGEPAHA